MLPLAVLMAIVVLRVIGVADHLAVPFACGFTAGFWLVCRRLLAQSHRPPKPRPTQPPSPHTTSNTVACQRCGKRKQM